MTREQMEQMEAATIAAMHEQRAPDLEYTPITAPLPELVRPAEVEALREEYSRLYIMWENAMQSLRAERARVAELEPLARITQNGYAGYCRWCGAHEIAPLPFSRWLDAMCIVTTVRP